MKNNQHDANNMEAIFYQMTNLIEALKWISRMDPLQCV